MGCGGPSCVSLLSPREGNGQMEQRQGRVSKAEEKQRLEQGPDPSRGLLGRPGGTYSRARKRKAHLPLWSLSWSHDLVVPPGSLTSLEMWLCLPFPAALQCPPCISLAVITSSFSPGGGGLPWAQKHWSPHLPVLGVSCLEPVFR